MSNEQDAQADILNSTVKATLKPSKIHGIGVFALRDIAMGEKVYADQLPKVFTLSYGNMGKLFPGVKKIILERWSSIINGSKFISPDARLVSFMNHGGDKSSYDTNTDTALTDIKKGEEVTKNYKSMENWEKVYPFLKDVV